MESFVSAPSVVPSSVHVLCGSSGLGGTTDVYPLVSSCFIIQDLFHILLQYLVLSSFIVGLP